MGSSAGLTLFLPDRQAIQLYLEISFSLTLVGLTWKHLLRAHSRFLLAAEMKNWVLWCQIKSSLRLPMAGHLHLTSSTHWQGQLTPISVPITKLKWGHSSLLNNLLYWPASWLTCAIPFLDSQVMHPYQKASYSLTLGEPSPEPLEMCKTQNLSPSQQGEKSLLLTMIWQQGPSSCDFKLMWHMVTTSFSVMNLPFIFVEKWKRRMFSSRELGSHRSNCKLFMTCQKSTCFVF